MLTSLRIILIHPPITARLYSRLNLYVSKLWRSCYLKYLSCSTVVQDLPAYTLVKNLFRLKTYCFHFSCTQSEVQFKLVQLPDLLYYDPVFFPYSKCRVYFFMVGTNLDLNWNMESVVLNPKRLVAENKSQIAYGHFSWMIF